MLNKSKSKRRIHLPSPTSLLHWAQQQLHRWPSTYTVGLRRRLSYIKWPVFKNLQVRCSDCTTSNEVSRCRDLYFRTTRRHQACQFTSTENQSKNQTGAPQGSATESPKYNNNPLGSQRQQLEITSEYSVQVMSLTYKVPTFGQHTHGCGLCSSNRLWDFKKRGKMINFIS